MCMEGSLLDLFGVRFVSFDPSLHSIRRQKDLLVHEAPTQNHPMGRLHLGVGNGVGSLSCSSRRWLVLISPTRIMEKFSERYHEENPKVFSCAETAYVLSFSLMMLNTDMYNRNLKVSTACPIAPCP